MDDWIEIECDPQHVKRERTKAKELKKTAYFKNLLHLGVCKYCGQKFSIEKLTIDHIVPLSRGGRSTKGNMAVSCLECNSKKKYFTPVDIILNEENTEDI